MSSSTFPRGVKENQKFGPTGFELETVMMMMIAYITINSGLVPLIEGLCAQI